MPNWSAICWAASVTPLAWGPNTTPVLDRTSFRSEAAMMVLVPTAAIMVPAAAFTMAAATLNRFPMPAAADPAFPLDFAVVSV